MEWYGTIHNYRVPRWAPRGQGCDLKLLGQVIHYTNTIYFANDFIQNDSAFKVTILVVIYLKLDTSLGHNHFSGALNKHGFMELLILFNVIANVSFSFSWFGTLARQCIGRREIPTLGDRSSHTKHTYLITVVICQMTEK